MIQTRMTVIRQKLEKIGCFDKVYRHDQFTQESVDELKQNVRALLLEIRSELYAINEELNQWHP
jgi:hypothetical protein